VLEPYAVTVGRTPSQCWAYAVSAGVAHAITVLLESHAVTVGHTPLTVLLGHALHGAERVRRHGARSHAVTSIHTPGERIRSSQSCPLRPIELGLRCDIALAHDSSCAHAASNRAVVTRPRRPVLHALGGVLHYESVWMRSA